MNIRALLDERIGKALTDAVGADTPLPALVAPSANPKFGDYQANGVMAAAKRARTNPRELAGEVIERLDLSDVAEKVEIAGPGFINVTLSDAFLSAQAAAAAGDDRLTVPTTEKPQTVVVDYSAPNLAKEMHVGHLRSTIIGDSIANVLGFLGHNVIRQNHFGDWGTQFGMLIAYLKRTVDDFSSLQISDLEEFYRESKKLFDSDPAFADTARAEVVALQSGDPESRKAWQVFINESKRHCAAIYNRLNVKLRDEHDRPESSYNDDLPSVVADLEAAGLLTESQGARCVFLEEFTGHDDKPLPVIVQKTDGGYLYATTDLAGMRHRAGTLKADRILYVTDAGQGLHFQQVFAVAKKAGFVGADTSLEHVSFGVMLGEGGRRFRTREGGVVKLMALLNEAVERAQTAVADKSPGLSAADQARIAGAVGVGAVKYADLSMDRTSDYRFSWSKMLAMQGNTAPYMQYAYARVRSIFRKGAEEAGDLAGTDISLTEPDERELAKRLLRLPETLASVATECRPNILTNYLFELASCFSSFYESCPVLKSDPAIRASRLRLCDLTARVIRQGLDLLGIDVIEQM